ncbi:MAG: crossover junction endodeoxyribonuclease RuvC [Candidatus Omnitrophica bacterium]|nr:crossover junction endodeoxyribonuclease RuvC [Candidatus Omnitrophota bacterium]
MRILAVDVGFRVCGYAICDVQNLDVLLIKEGEIKPFPKQALPQKLNYIFEELTKEIKFYNPKAIVVETLYSHHRHPTTMGLLAQVRGAIVLLAERCGLEFYEYAPTRARKCFLGRGNVNSFQVKKMAENVTGKEFMSIHTADAFSLAVAFSHTQKFQKLSASLPDCARKTASLHNRFRSALLENSKT